MANWIIVSDIKWWLISPACQWKIFLVFSSVLQPAIFYTSNLDNQVRRKKICNSLSSFSQFPLMLFDIVFMSRCSLEFSSSDWSVLINNYFCIFSLSWVDGTPVTYVAWAPNEPNFANNEENCVVMSSKPGK